MALTIYFGLTWSWNRSTGDLRVWGAMPFIFLLMLFSISGFFVEKWTQRAVQPTHSPSRPKKRHWLNPLLFVVGLGTWLYGVFVPIPEPVFIFALLGAVMAMMYAVISVADPS
jgi:hypothetical protein